MTLDEKRQEEYRFYRDLYTNHNYHPSSSPRLQVTNKVVQEYGEGFSTWLDVGCGGHVIEVPESVDYFIRTDPGHPEAMHSVAIHQLVQFYGEQSFEVVSCFDVLEHLFPEELDEGIQNLWGVTEKRLLVSVGTGHGGNWGRDHPTHRTIKKAGWWLLKLSELTGNREVNQVANAKGTSPFFLIDR